MAARETSLTEAGPRWPLALSIAFALIVIGYIVASLDSSSLWLDELMSLYYSDPANRAEGRLWQVMNSDLHPPGFYVLFYAWQEIFGSSVFSARFLSTLIMTIVLVIYIVHVTRRFGAHTTALVLPIIVVSHIFVVYAQEVRGYSLLILLGLIAAIVYENLCRYKTAFYPGLAAVSILAFLTETIHPYGVLWAGSLCAGLLLYRQRLAERAAVIVAGIALLIYPLARLAKLSGLAEEHYNWFEFLNPVVELLFGLARPVFVLEDLWIVLVGCLAIAWFIARRQIDWERLSRATPLLLLIPTLVTMALTIHFLIEPSFNDRNLAILAPVIWLLMPYAVDSIAGTRLNTTLVVAVVAALSLNHVARSSWIQRGFKSEWRNSAAFVDSQFDRCATEAIPVFAYTYPDRDTHFYSRYLTNEFSFTFVDRADLDNALSKNQNSDCPIRFWSPHGLGPEAVATDAELAALGYEVLEFDHAAQWRETSLPGAFVIVDTR